MRKWFFLIFGLLISFSLFSQQAEAEIEIINFNSTASYASGSSVSVHMNTKGIYDRTENTFSLYISDENGDFNGGEILLSSLSSFYTPLINATLPSGLTADGDYYLRVVASDGFISYNPPTEPQIIPTSFNQSYITYGERTSDDIPITIINQNIESDLIIESSIDNNEIFFNCIDTNEVNPNLGSVVQSSGSTTNDLPNADSVIVITSDAQDLNIRIIDILNGTQSSIDPSLISDIGGNQFLFYIPSDLDIGTYNLEFEETFESGANNVYSFSLIWHSNAPTLTSVSNNEICVSDSFNFVVSSSYSNGIGRNFYGSYYSINWGDSSPIEYYTHAFILAYNEIFNSQSIELENNYFSHAFEGPSCNLDDGSVYNVRLDLYNILECDDYLVNGGGSAVDVNASDPPVAEISHDDQYLSLIHI